MNYPKGHEFEFQYIRPSQIKCDPLYQRKLNVKQVDEIVEKFNGDTFNEPKVSYRDGQYWVFDGQHSITAWKKLYNNEDKPIYCKVFKGMTWLEECDAFCQQNGIKRDPTTNDKLRAAKNAGDPAVVDMVHIAELCGYVVDFNPGRNRNRILATAALFRAYQRLGREAFGDMLTAIKEAWYGDDDAISSQILSGMATFYKTYYGNFKRADLVASLRKVTPTEIIRNGRSYRNRSNTYTREIIKCYNHRRKYRLDDSLVA